MDAGQCHPNLENVELLSAADLKTRPVWKETRSGCTSLKPHRCRACVERKGLIVAASSKSGSNAGVSQFRIEELRIVPA
jgi:hypothetical protein